MQVLVPFMSCVVTPDEFNEETQKVYNDIYIVTPEAFFRHVKLSKGRFVRYQVNEIPGYKRNLELKEEVNFLPAGRIPYRLLEEIVQFFKDVMNIKKAEQEAMAHVLWNEQKGYHIAIPNQTVSKASVRYEFDHIQKGDIIALDIHSHNTMGAFFSGTDDTDDKKTYAYVGVVGRLNDRTPEFVWRLNIGEARRPSTLSEIFDVSESEISIPKEWLDKVKTHSAVATPNRQEHFKFDDLKGYNRFLNESDFPGDRAIYGEYFSGKKPRGVGERNEPAPAKMERSLQDQVFEDASSEFYSEGIAVDFDQTNTVFEVGEVEANIINFGKDAAEAHEQITTYLLDLDDQDELLMDIIKSAYRMLSYEYQAKIATHGF